MRRWRLDRREYRLSLTRVRHGCPPFYLRRYLDCDVTETTLIYCVAVREFVGGTQYGLLHAAGLSILGRIDAHHTLHCLTSSVLTAWQPEHIAR